jgi:beta-glucosidase
MVLLKNENNALPLARTTKRLHVAGKAANDLGIQCGGWTIDWQGRTGEVTHGGTTILAAIRNSVAAGSEVSFSTNASGIAEADAIVVVIGEMPYAEMKGDRPDLKVSPEDLALVKKMKQAKVPVVTILLSGRPLVLGELLQSSDAFLAAWLPGTEGQGVADVLFGNYAPTGKLPCAWPREAAVPPFKFGFGLTYPAAEATKQSANSTGAGSSAL